MAPRIIEWNLPLEEISKAATREKSVRHGHPSTLHLWWARRPLASSRTTTFAALIDLPESDKDRMELINVIKDLAPWSSVKDGNGPIIKLVRSILDEKWNNPPKILDPFAGGGSIPLEALRLGCETYANDLNPVAAFILKATLEWPRIHPRFVMDRVKYWAKRIKEEAYQEIGHFYPADPNGWIPSGYLWARTIPCSFCESEMPLIKHFWLAKKKGKKIAYKPQISHKPNSITFTIQRGDKIDFDPSQGTVNRGDARCLICGKVTKAISTRKLAAKGRMNARMIGVILRHPQIQGKRYRLVTPEDVQIWQQARVHLDLTLSQWPWEFSPLPDEPLPPQGSLGVNLKAYGFNQWKDLFNARQQLANLTFLRLLRSSIPAIREDCSRLRDNEKVSKAILGYLSLILGRLVDKNANLVVYNVYGEKIEHVFGRTALPIKWDYAELNVFSGGNGDWEAHTNWVLRFLNANTWDTRGSTTITCESATRLAYPEGFFDCIITDPPYYDNVPYSDLSDFFYVWLKRAVGDLFPDLFSTPLTPKATEIVANKRRHSNPRQYFESELSKAFREMYRVLRQDGIAVIVYAHKSADGWEAFMNALAEAGFVVTAAMPIQTEMKTRLRAKTSIALASSLHIVCRKMPKRPNTPFATIKSEFEHKIRQTLKDQSAQRGSGGDAFNVAIGPALEIWSKYEGLTLPSGLPLTARDLLEIIYETFGLRP
ncbi:MAG: DUF1156 domain-containing protein [Candidatus Thorarchaeota archaeon]